MKRLVIGAMLAVALAFPAVALAEKINSDVSIHKTFDQDRIYGVVQSPAHKCERNREIVLFYRPFQSPDFAPIASELTDSLGQYDFEAQLMKRAPAVEEGQYFARATRKSAGADVCRRDDSRVIEVAGVGG